MSTTITAGNATNNGASIASDTAGTIEIKTGSTPTTAITVDTSQNVGIGTSSPAAKLEVSTGGGTKLRVTSTIDNNADIDFYTNSVQRGIIEGNSVGMLFGTTGALPNMFITNNTERMRIDSSGNLLVGTTSSIGGLLQVNNTANSSGANFQCTNASFTTQVIQAITTKAAGTDFTLFRGVVNNAGTVVYNVFGNGNVTNTNGSYAAISDIKLKENIVDATPKLDDLMQIKVRNYNLKSDPTFKQIGVVAQELEQIFPALVEETADSDVDGNDLGTTTKSVKYSIFIPMLIKAIQELNAKVDAQAAEIAALKGAK